MAVDPLELSRALIRCPSITPQDAGALDVVQNALEELGFACHRLPFSEPGQPQVDNLYARLGTAAPNLCFAGHTDVVPVGDRAAWTSDPFGGQVRDDRLYGRGAVDMKGAIACFIAAVAGFLADRGDGAAGSISLLITGDEEGAAVNGTVKVLRWLKDRGETLDDCIVGEPTNPDTLGEMIKIGRRGSINCTLGVKGVQGHAAYPERADNPIPRLMAMLSAITSASLDDGSEHFPPSTVTVTTIDVGNEATNVIPAQARAAFNIRFNDNHTADGLSAWVKEHCDTVGGDYDLQIDVSAHVFLTPPGRLSGVIAQAVKAVTGREAELSTTGGTSDARFIKDHCPVAEFGLISDMAHKVDENVAVDDLRALTAIYGQTLTGYFAK